MIFFKHCELLHLSLCLNMELPVSTQNASMPNTKHRSLTFRSALLRHFRSSLGSMTKGRIEAWRRRGSSPRSLIAITFPIVHSLLDHFGLLFPICQAIHLHIEEDGVFLPILMINPANVNNLLNFFLFL